MIGHIIDFVRLANGAQRVTVEIAGDFSEQYDHLHDKTVDIEIKKHREKRSLDANAYAWVLIDKIAAEMNMTKIEVYRRAILDIGGVSTIVCVPDKSVEALRKGWEIKGAGWLTEVERSKLEGCTNVTLYFGSSVYDSRQMSRLIDYLVDEAQDLGIETATPEEIARYIDLWAVKGE